jgi:hypothetical protein
VGRRKGARRDGRLQSAFRGAQATTTTKKLRMALSLEAMETKFGRENSTVGDVYRSVS